MLATACIVALGCGDGPTSFRALQRGVIDVTVATTGAEPDPDGYRLVIDDVRDYPSSANGDLRVGYLDAGTHLLRLDDVASNCQVAGANPRSVTVAGGRASSTTFTVSCVQFTGSIRVTTTTTGEELDPDGYAVVVDQDDYYPREGEPIARDGSVTFTRVPGGEHTISLEDVARNCSVSGENPRPTSVSPGAETAVAFVVQCDRPGALRVIAVTTGPDVDPDGYSAGIATARFDTAAMLLPNDTITVGVPAGDFTVVLSGVSANCEPTGTSSRTGSVASSDTVELTFDVSCATAGQLAIVDGRDGNPEIYLIKANGAELTRLTMNAASDGDPAWSPDGSRIAFHSNRDGNNEIYVMNSDGSNLVRLTNASGDDSSPTWSPDGARIAFTSERTGNSNIYVMNADGTNVVRLTDPEYYYSDVHPAWSPDGQRIAFMRWVTGGYDIFVMNADGSGLTALTTGDDDHRSPAWSPDGTRIAFSRAVDCYYYCEYDLAVMNADGSGVTPLPIAACDEHDPAWSPDGSRIAFTSRQSYYGVGCPTSVMVMRTDGTNATVLTNGDASAPAWRP
jgi:Tol biopolymer transport system component